MSYLKRVTKRRAAQSAPIPGSTQVANSTGGLAWPVDDWAQLRRFPILGSEGGSRNAGDWTLSRENAAAAERSLAVDGPRTAAGIVVVSATGRAPENHAMVSNGFSIADPHDPGMLDVVGLDTATPQLISNFARGAL